MPTTYAIPNGSTAFAATLWTGDGANPRTITNTVNGVSLQPDLVWIKARSNAYDHTLYDSIRGATNYLISNSTAAEQSAANTLQAFNSNGFQVGGSNSTNSGSVTYVGWQWKANGAAVTNTAGSITSQVSANTAAGFSVVTFTGTGSAATIGHGLGVKPSMIFFKVRSNGTYGWYVYNSVLNATNHLVLNTTAAVSSSPGLFNDTEPTSSVMTVGTSLGTNQSGQTYVAYCFAAVPGYSAFGSYTGNGSTDGPFVYTGFRPRFIIIKETTPNARNWVMYDSSRNPSNQVGLQLLPNLNNSEDTGSGLYNQMDFLSNGIKFRSGTNSEPTNESGATYVYACWAENPFKYANAR
jgi:hypothetical protein